MSDAGEMREERGCTNSPVPLVFGGLLQHNFFLQLVAATPRVQRTAEGSFAYSVIQNEVEVQHLSRIFSCVGCALLLIIIQLWY